MIPSFLSETNGVRKPITANSKRVQFVDRTSHNMASFVVTGMQQWNASQRAGWLQALSAPVKVLFVLCYVVLVSILQSVAAQLALVALLFFLFLISKVSLASVYRRAAFITFVFGFLVFIPAALNLFTKGDMVFTLVNFHKEYNWFIYHLPAQIGFTRQGLALVAHLCLKLFNSVSLTLLLINTTSFEQIVKALRILRVPEIFVLTLTMSYKFIFIFSQTLLESYLALKMRWWNRGRQTQASNIIAGRMGYLFRKAWERYELVYQSMMARGYTGNVRLYYAEKLRSTDYLFSAFAFIVFVLLLCLNYAWK